MLSVHMFLIIKFYFNENQKQIMLRLFSLIGILFLFLLISTGAGLCADDAPDTSSGILIRTEVRPKENIVVGQQVILQVDVLAPDGWAQIKGVRDFSVEGTQVVRYETQGTRLNETIQGQAFTGQRYELSLFPRRDGIVTVPSIPVEVEVSWSVVSWPYFRVQRGPIVFGLSESAVEITLPSPVDPAATLSFVPGSMRQGSTAFLGPDPAAAGCSSNDRVGVVWFQTVLSSDGSRLTVHRGSDVAAARGSWTVVEVL